MKKYFVAGTDTGVGKTAMTVALLNHFKQQGLSTAALKPIASGCDEVDGKLYNEDAQAMLDAMTHQCDYSKVNPYAFLPPIAPHLAAKDAGIDLNVASLLNSAEPMLLAPVDILLIEGAGGWMVPLNEKETLADFVEALELPVILVVGMRLGCINHALLTYEQITSRKLTMAGWIANCLSDDMLYLQENIATLKKLLPAPCMGVVSYNLQDDHQQLKI